MTKISSLGSFALRPILNSLNSCARQRARKAETCCVHRSTWPRQCSIEKCPAGQGQHPHAGGIHSYLLPPTALAGFQAQKSTMLPLPSAAAQLGTTRLAAGVGSSCVCPWSALRGARRRAGPGPYQITFAAEAARFQRPAARAICHSVSPGEAGPPLDAPFCPQTELSLGPGSPSLSPQGGCRGPSTEMDQSQELKQCPLAAPGRGWCWRPVREDLSGDRDGNSDLEAAGPFDGQGEESRFMAPVKRIIKPQDKPHNARCLP